MEYLNCQLSGPITWENIPPATSTDFWQYSKLQCELPYQSTITDGTTTFYTFKTITSGDLLIIFFLLLFLFAGIFKFIWSIIPRAYFVRKIGRSVSFRK